MNLVWITDAKYIEDFKISLVFNDGVKGIVELSKKLKNLPIHEPLKNKEYFKTFKLNSWTIEWDNGADFAPESLYELTLKQKAHNKTCT